MKKKNPKQQKNTTHDQKKTNQTKNKQKTKTLQVVDYSLGSEIEQFLSKYGLMERERNWQKLSSPYSRLFLTR